MQSAIVGSVPNRNGPFHMIRHSCQMEVILSISACADDHTVKPGRLNRKFIGKDERKAANPECISPEIERHLALAWFSRGSIPASGKFSLRYSAMAIVSQTLTSVCSRQGTRIEEVRISNSSFARGSSAATLSSLKVIPESLARRKPRKDQDE